MHQLIDICVNFKRNLFAAPCLLCSARKALDIGICQDCLNDLPWHNKNFCQQCGLESQGGQLCGHCLKSPPAFDKTHALMRYEFPADAMLRRYKYSHSLTLAETFGRLLAESATKRSLPDLVIPMPLHPQRLRERGFNQAAEIAKVVARSLQIKMDSQSCSRTKLAPPQATLPLKDRVKNMKGAFSCQSSLDGLRVALVDDVMTTGASLHALAQSVKQAGAAHVECWVIARTLPK